MTNIITGISVDEFEVEKFNNLTENDWWDVNGPVKMLHFLIPIMVHFFINEMKTTKIIDTNYINTSTPLHGLNILVIGCGGGIHTESVAKFGGILTGIDPAGNAIAVAKKHALRNNLNINYIHSGVEDFCMENAEKFDVVTIPEVLEHVIEKEVFLDYCAKCVKPGGSLFVTGFNKTFRSWLVTIVLWENVFHILFKGSHDWHNYISPEKTKKFLVGYNMEIKSATGYSLDLRTNKFKMTEAMPNMYEIHAVKKI